MYEKVIQLKENPIPVNESYQVFEAFDLSEVEKAFESIELVSYQEIKKIRVADTILTLRALPSGSSVGGACWHMELNGLSVVYALDLNDHETAISAPL